MRAWTFPQLALSSALLALSACTHAQDGAALAVFKSTLGSHASATAALGQWCAAREIADPARISAARVHGHDLPPPAGLRRTLGVNSDETLGYRHVRLACGDTVLSEAHNWYVPARLAAEMNRELAETDTPFGRVVASLGFRRIPLSSGSRHPACPTGTILANQAVLRLPDGQGLAMVIECYTAANLSASRSRKTGPHIVP